MSPSAAIRWGGGLTSVAAGVLLLVGHVVNLGGDPEYGTVLGEVLVLSASFDPERIEEANSAGADEIMDKLTPVDEILATVRRLGGTRARSRFE